MQYVYRRIMGLYKGDCERLRILCRESSLSASRSIDIENLLYCRLVSRLPLFVEHNENRPTVKKRAKVEKDQTILDKYDIAFYKECSTAYPFLTADKSDVYYEEEIRCVIPSDIRELFKKSTECQRCVTIGPVIPDKIHPRMQQVDSELVDAIIKTIQKLKEEITEGIVK